MNSIRVLLVDDYEPFRRAVVSRLRDQPTFVIVAEASDGLEAIHKAKELQPDLILLDVGLPKLNGIEAARQIRQLSPGSRILFVSELRSDDIAEAALNTGRAATSLSRMEQANYCMQEKLFSRTSVSPVRV